MKKILLPLVCLLLCFVLFGCSAGNAANAPDTDVSDRKETSRLIKPLNDSEVFELIGDEGIKSDLRAVADGKITPNYILKMLGKPIPDFSVKDYNGETYSFGDDFFVLELVASWCEHCQAQAREYNKDLAAEGVKIVQYFNADDKAGIDEYYKAVGTDGHPEEDVTLIPHDDKLTAFVEEEYQPLYYPTFIIFDGGQVVYATSGHLSVYDLARMQKVIDRKLKADDLRDAKGESIFKDLLTYQDVEKEIGETKLELLKQIDHDDNTYALTIASIGRVIDFESLYHFGGQYVNEVDDFEDLATGDQLILMIGDESKKDELAKLVSEAKELGLSVYVMTMGNTELTSHPDCKVFSSRAAIPVDIANIEIASSLSAAFLKDGVIAGVYSDPVSLDLAYDLFLGSNALVLSDRS